MSNAWIPFYPGDYLKDTQHLTVYEHGTYLKLLLYCWSKEQPLPLDKKTIYRIGGASTKKQRVILEKILSEFFSKNETGFVNLKSQKIINIQNEKRQKLTENGRKGGLASQANAQAKLKQTPEQNQSIPEPEPNISNLDHGYKHKVFGSIEPSARDAIASHEPIRSHIPKKKLESDFNELYEFYGHKIGRKKALEEYIKARKIATKEEILEGVKKYKSNKPDFAEWKHLSKWLSGECWNDVYTDTKKTEPIPYWQKLKKARFVRNRFTGETYDLDAFGEEITADGYFRGADGLKIPINELEQAKEKH